MGLKYIGLRGDKLPTTLVQLMREYEKAKTAAREGSEVGRLFEDVAAADATEDTLDKFDTYMEEQHLSELPEEESQEPLSDGQVTDDNMQSFRNYIPQLVNEIKGSPGPFMEKALALERLYYIAKDLKDA